MTDIIAPIDRIERWTGDVTALARLTQTESYRGTAVASTIYTSSLAEIFTSAGLGSREDVLFSILPPLLSRGKLPSLHSVATMLLLDAKLLRYDSEFSKAERILLGLVTADKFLD